MRIKSIEPTPSPNTMKLNMDQSLPSGSKMTYTLDNQHKGPDYVKKLLQIEGIQSLFQVNDFIAIERHPKGDWQQILTAARGVFGEEPSQQTVNADLNQLPTDEGFGEVHVFIQMFKGIPMQIKLTSGMEQVRVALPERFGQAALSVQSSSPNLVMERKWEEQGVRYGEMQQVGEEVKKEIDAAYDESRITQLVSQALQINESELDQISTKAPSISLDQLEDEDWKKRYAALSQISPAKENLPLLVKMLDDPHVSLRRLATAYLAMIEGADVLPYLYQALEDRTFAVRRTAGDAISDLGDPAAIPVMIKALKDPNKLVRWRAARFMYEVGDETAIPALLEAENDPEFEVSLQVKIALERIEGGELAEGTVWQQMTRSRAEQNESE